VNAWCDVFSRFVAVGTQSVLVFSAIDYVFSCVQYVFLVNWLTTSISTEHATNVVIK